MFCTYNLCTLAEDDPKKVETCRSGNILIVYYIYVYIYNTVHFVSVDLLTK